MGGKARKFSGAFLAAALVLGMIVGFGMNYVLTSPEIEGLTEEVEYKNGQIASLQETVDLLEENVTGLVASLADLEELYDDLAESTVPKSQYDALASEHQELEVDYDELEDDLVALEAQTSSLESVIENLTEQNQELLDEYEKLLAKYIGIRVLSWTYFELHGLRVNLTTTAITYDENRPIVGSMSIYHEGGQPFNGTVVLALWNDYYSSGTASDRFSIHGVANYSFPHPFILGPGTYYLRVSEIRDADGVKVVSSAEVREYSIKISMG